MSTSNNVDEQKLEGSSLQTVPNQGTSSVKKQTHAAEEQQIQQLLNNLVSGQQTLEQANNEVKQLHPNNNNDCLSQEQSQQQHPHSSKKRIHGTWSEALWDKQPITSSAFPLKEERSQHDRFSEPTGSTTTAKPQHTPSIRVSERSPLIVSANDMYEQVVANHTPTDSEITISDTVTTITDTLMAAFKSFFKQPDLMLIASLTSASVAIGTAITGLYRCADKAMLVMCGISVATSLTSLVTTFAACIKRYTSIKYCAERAVSAVTQIAASLSKTQVVSNSANWLYGAVTAIISVILSGLVACNVMSIKTVIEQGNFLRSINTINASVKDSARYLFEDLIGIDISGDSYAFRELQNIAKRSAELVCLPHIDYIKDPKLYLELAKFVEDALPAIERCNRAYRGSTLTKGAQSVITSNLQSLLEKKQAIDVIIGATKRQETLGILLSGKPGVGKSTLVAHLAKKIGSILSLDPSLYNINIPRADGFYNPYAGQAFGTCDEFMSMRSNDPNLKSLTQFLSGDHFNFEGAHLQYKYQPCNLKAAFFTTNVENPAKFMKSVLAEETVEAVWDRIIRIEVEDPKCQGRNSPNSHRSADFKHLQFYYVETGKSGLTAPEALKRTRITIEEVIGTITSLMAIRELNFLRQEMQSHPTLQQAIDQTRITERINFLKRLTPHAQANAGETFNVIRFQGPPGSGKTHVVKEITSKLQNYYCTLPITWVQDEEAFAKPPVKKGIYILDDVYEPTHECHVKYLRWINQGHVDNTYIIITNHEMHKTSSYLSSFMNYFITTPQYYKFDTKGASNGIMRRLGLNGTIIDENNNKVLSRGLCVNVPSPGMYRIDDYEHTRTSVYEEVFDFIKTHFRHASTVSIVHDKCYEPNLTLDAEITASSFNAFMNVMQSKVSILSALFRETEGVRIKASTKLINAIQKYHTDPIKLCPSKVVDEQSLIEQSVHISNTIMTLCPQANMQIVFADTSRVMTLFDRVLYIGQGPPPSSLPVFTDDMMNRCIRFVYNDTEINITYAEYTEFLNLHTPCPKLAELPDFIVVALHEYVKKNMGTINGVFQYHTWLCMYKKYTRTLYEEGFFPFIKEHWIMATLVAVASITALGGLATKLSLALAPKPIQAKANSADDDYFIDEVRTLAKEWKAQKRLGKSTAAIEQSARQQGFYDRGEKYDLSAYIADYHAGYDPFAHANASYGVTMYQRGVIQANAMYMKAGLEADPTGVENYLRTATANMLTRNETKHQPDSRLELFVKRLRKNYVKVTSQRGIAYGINTHDRNIISVSHLFDSETEECIITSDGKNYKGVVRHIFRKRDLSYIEVEPNFHLGRDIRNSFIDQAEFTDINRAYYLRPMESALSIELQVNYIPRSIRPVKDDNNPYYTLSEEFWSIEMISVKKMADDFKIGDCGLPLIIDKDNKFYIVGIHNGLLLAQRQGWFSALSNADFTIAARANSSSLNVITRNGTELYVEDRLAAAYNNSPMWRARVADHGLDVVGYSPEFRFHSRPENKKIFLDTAFVEFDNPKLPSATTLHYVDNTDDLVKDNNGKPLPLFTQAIKYAKSTDTNGKWEEEYDKHSSYLLMEYYNYHYGDAYRLKLHQIINDFQHLQTYDMETSAGPKMKKFYNINQKRPIGDEEVLFVNINQKGQRPFYFINRETEAGCYLKDDYETLKSVLDSGNPILMFCKDNAKVELLPAEKAKRGKVRLFNEIDLSVNMVLKHYFGGFMNSVVSKHATHYYTIGMNPYTDATSHMLVLNSMDGYLCNADYTSMDKTISAHLIRDFVFGVLRDKFTEATKEAIAITLTKRLHTQDGILYFTDNGNASGSYVTTLMNCHAVAKVTIYTFVRKWKEQYGYLPTLKELDGHLKMFIQGDDAIRKFSNSIKVSPSDLIEDAALYGLLQTPAKTEGEVGFCSRSYVHYRGLVYFPQLKSESIIANLFWFTKADTEQVKANCIFAVTEASMHDITFFTKVKKAVIALSKKFNFMLDLLTYEQYREMFFNICCPQVGFKEPENFNINENLIIQANSQTTNKINMQNEADYVSRVYSTIAKSKTLKRATPYSVFTRTGTDDLPVWHCNVHLASSDGNTPSIHCTGTATTKRESKQMAFYHLSLELKDSLILPKNIGSLEDVEVFKDELQIDVSGYKKGIPYAITLPVTDDDDYETIIKALDELAVTYQRGKAAPSKKPPTYAKANADQPITPAAMNQASSGMQIASLPAGSNAQPTTHAPEMHSAGESVVASVGIMDRRTLNPVGAPNMLPVGAITFDLKDLIYKNYLDADVQINIGDDRSAGTVVAQIPYGPENDYVNKYIRAYAAMHDRYSGAIEYRVSVIGNPMFSGAIGIAWMPERVSASVIDISELQKYSYHAQGVTLNWNVIHTLHDARQDRFFRKMGENLDSAPHLVLFLLMDIVNPLREGVNVRVRIASKLANQESANPFIFANPVISGSSGSTGVYTPILEKFPSLKNGPRYVYTDGTLRNDYQPDTSHYKQHYDATMSNLGNYVRNAYKTTISGVTTYGSYSKVSSSPYSYAESALATVQWPTARSSLNSQLATTDGNLWISVNISTMTNMTDAQLIAFYQACPVKGFIDTTTPTEGQWNRATTLSEYGTYGTDNISSIVRGNTSFVISQGWENLSGTSRVVGCRMHQVVRFTTRYGYIQLYCTFSGMVYNGFEWNQTRAFFNMAAFRVNEAGFAPTPNVLIDDTLGAINPVMAPLPAGYQALRITDVPATVVTINGYTGPTTTDDFDIAGYFFDLRDTLAVDESFQFTLVDRNNLSVVAVVRYLRTGVFVIRDVIQQTPHAILPTRLQDIMIGPILKVLSLSEFPPTNTALWVPRGSDAAFNTLPYATRYVAPKFDPPSPRPNPVNVPSSTLKPMLDCTADAQKAEALDKEVASYKKKLADVTPPKEVRNEIAKSKVKQVTDWMAKVNKTLNVNDEPWWAQSDEIGPSKQEPISATANAAAIIGGALGGIGQGIDKWQDRQHQEKLQGNQFAHNSQMQHNHQLHQLHFQQNDFVNSLTYQHNNFQQEYNLQSNRFSHDAAMSNLNAANRMAERGLSSRAHFFDQGQGYASLGRPSAVSGSTREGTEV